MSSDVVSDAFPDSVVSDDTEYVEEEVWEELSDDNGEIIEFKKDSHMEGYFIHVVTIELPEDQQKTLSDGSTQTDADLYVFESNKDSIESRWSVWSNYSLRKITFQEGEYYSVRCIGARKTAQGEMKVFSVRQRKTVKAARF